MKIDTELKNKAEYLIALISEFARAHRLTDSQAYRYLDRFRAIDFITRHYDVAHTQRFEDVVNDITAYCRRHGGALT